MVKMENKNIKLEEFKSATESFLSFIKKDTTFIYLSALALVEMLTNYSKNFTISDSELMDGDNCVTQTKVCVDYLNAYTFCIVTDAREDVRKGVFNIWVVRHDGFSAQGDTLETDDVENAFNWIVKYEEGK